MIYYRYRNQSGGFNNEKIYQLTDEELLNQIIDGDEYDLDAMIEYFSRKCLEYDDLDIDEMYEAICDREGI